MPLLTAPILPLTCRQREMDDCRFLLAHAAGAQGRLALAELDARAKLIADLAGQVATLLREKRDLTVKLAAAQPVPQNGTRVGQTPPPGPAGQVMPGNNSLP